MLYKQGHYYWRRFNWNAILIRASTQVEDLLIAQEILKMRRSKLAIEHQSAFNRSSFGC
jgi:cephalosporin hydroxylase